MNKLIQAVKQFWNDEQGMGAVEYALIVAIMAAAIASAWSILSEGISDAFVDVAGQLTGGGDTTD